MMEVNKFKALSIGLASPEKNPLMVLWGSKKNLKQ